jgi:hypothetical protein
MRSFAAHARGRLALAATLFATAMATTIAAAPTASAAVPKIQQCQGGYALYSNVTVSPPPNASINVVAYLYCVLGYGTIDQNITISKYIGNNVWQTVATGKGEVAYNCTGGRYAYLTNYSSSQFYCG